MNLKKYNTKGMNVLKFGCYGHWWNPSNIKQFFCNNLRYAYQRIRYGFAECDCWGMCDYLSQLMYLMINNLADTAHGYPCTNECPTPEEWDRILRELAQHIYFAIEREDNPIDMEAQEIFEKVWAYEDKDLLNIIQGDYSGMAPEDIETYNMLKEQWRKKMEEVYKVHEQEKDIAFDMLKHWFYNLWD